MADASPRRILAILGLSVLLGAVAVLSLILNG